MSKFKVTASIIGVVALLIGLSWGAEYLNIVRLGIFKPMRENVERQVFENTKSYVHGAAQDLAKYFDEYQQADDLRKKTIKQVILMRFPELDASKLPSVSLQSFLRQMRGY